MKKRLIAVSNILLALAVVLALAVGFNMGSMLDFSRNFISEAFPVNYNIKMSDGSVITEAEVFFNGDKAFISSERFSGTVSIESAIFTCIEQQQLAKNIVRSGMLFSLLTIFNLAAVCVPSFAAMSFRAKAAKIRTRRVVRIARIASENSNHTVDAAA